MTAFTEFRLLGKGGLFIINSSFIAISINNFFGITKNYINIIPIDIVGLIDPNYIECYHNIIIPLEVLFLLYSYCKYRYVHSYIERKLYIEL